MPKINAETVQEHVAQQTARLLEVASQLFRERGFRGTDLADIASALGLARNSLYRYYPNKDYLLVACVERDMGPVLKKFSSLEVRYPDPHQRVMAWLDLSLDVAIAPTHASLQLISEVEESAPQLREQISRLHRAPAQVLEKALHELLGETSRDVELLTAMISAMARSAAGVAIRRGAKPAIRREIRASVERLIEI